jgi:hypothetical protein
LIVKKEGWHLNFGNMKMMARLSDKRSPHRNYVFFTGGWQDKQKAAAIWGLNKSRIEKSARNIKPYGARLAILLWYFTWILCKIQRRKSLALISKRSTYCEKKTR